MHVLRTVGRLKRNPIGLLGWLATGLFIAVVLNLYPAASQVETRAEGIDPGSWISPDDMPLESVRNAEHGRVGVLIEVNAQGIAISCRVTSSSGFIALDRATCSLLMKRARFKPIVSATSATFATGIRWALPEGQPAGSCISHVYQDSLNSSQVLVTNRCTTPTLANICARMAGSIGTISQGERVEPGKSYLFTYFNASKAAFVYNMNSCAPGTSTRKDLCIPECPAAIRSCNKPLEPSAPKVVLGETKEEYLTRGNKALLEFGDAQKAFLACQNETARVQYSYPSSEYSSWAAGARLSAQNSINGFSAKIRIVYNSIKVPAPLSKEPSTAQRKPASVAALRCLGSGISQYGYRQLVNNCEFDVIIAYCTVRDEDNLCANNDLYIGYNTYLGTQVHSMKAPLSPLQVDAENQRFLALQRTQRAQGYTCRAQNDFACYDEIIAKLTSSRTGYVGLTPGAVHVSFVKEVGSAIVAGYCKFDDFSAGRCKPDPVKLWREMGSPNSPSGVRTTN